MVKMGFERGSEEQARLGELLWEVHAAGGKIIEFTSGRTWEEYADNEVLRAVVEKMLGLMAEALKEMQRGFPEEFVKAEGAGQILEAGTRANEAKIWPLVHKVVPELVAQTREMLEEWHQG